MKYPFVDLQTTVRDLLLWLGERGFPIWLCIAVILFSLLGLSVYFKYLLRDPSFIAGKTIRLVSSGSFFISLIFALVLILKIPAYALFEINPDESQWIASSNTLIKDPRFWYSVDGTTNGPLVVFPLTLIHFLGGTINYGTVRLAGAIMWSLCIISVYKSFANLFNELLARLIVLPLIICVSTFSYFDYVAYNGEHMPVLFLSVCFYLFSRIISEKENTRPLIIFACSFILGCVPYSKLQAAPIALIMAAFIMWFLKKKQFLIYITGGITPSLFVLIYLLSFDLFDDFFKSYLLNNLTYAKEGALFHGIGIDSSRRLTLMERLNLFPNLLFNAIETRYYFILLLLTSLFAGTICILKRKTISLSDKKLITFAFFLFLTSCYTIIQPGNDYGHYVLLSVIPITILTGILTGMAYKYSMFIRNRRIIAALILLAAVYQLPHNIYACRNAYMNGPLELILSSPAKQVLKYADPGERLAIWGWANIYFVETHMIQGTREPHTERQIRESELKEYYQKRYAKDLYTNKPGVFIDAVGKDRSNFTDRKTQGHENYPVVKQLIDSLYLFAAEIEDVRIYMLSEKARGRQYNIINYPEENPEQEKDLNINYAIEKFEEGHNYIFFSGWSFINGLSTEDSEIEVLLLNQENSFSFKTSYIYRKDITKFYKNSGLNLDYAGFSTVIPRTVLPDNRYRVALKITNQPKEGICLTDYYISNSTSGFSLYKSVEENEKPKLIQGYSGTKAEINYQLEEFEKSEGKIKLSGWAYLAGQDANEKKINILFRSATKIYRINTKLVLRPDVTDYFRNNNMNFDFSGFSAIINSSALEKGTYNVIIEIEDKKTGKEFISSTDKTFIIN